MRLVLIGPPGAGKGTIAEKLAAKYGLAHLSSGDMLRDAISRGAPLGAKAKEYVESGRLVPQEVLGEVVAEKLREVKAFILDGYPRTLEQAEFITALPYVDIDAVIYVAVGEEKAVERLRGRRVCAKCGAVTHADAAEVCGNCGSDDLVARADDRPDTLKKRYEVYMLETEPVVEYYRGRGLLRQVDGTGSREEVRARVEAAIGPFGARGDDNR
ncbi:MAG TPA: adenylate kinase [bacterium]|nr:adenylate kinase [bacterium]